MNKEPFRMGIDIGSTTAKAVISNQDAEVQFSEYRRHNAETLLTLQAIIQEALQSLGDIKVNLLVTGSAGLGVSEKFNIPFIQEVVASAEVVSQLYPEVKTLIDIGGEDAKMIFFNAARPPDIRMNGSCAGGTGAFIDEMANLLNVQVSELSNLAEKHTRIYPIASRCGVFAKTDVQNLLSRKTAWEDIAASIFNAVVLQTLATLSRGHKLSPLILFSGGPLTFLPALKDSFVRVLNIDRDSLLEAENTELLPAIGAALANSANRREISLAQLMNLLGTVHEHEHTGQNRLSPLFEDGEDFGRWVEARTQHRVDRIDIRQMDGVECFLGVDSGSTTTKLVLTDRHGRIVFDFYCNNNGNSMQAVREGLERIRQLFAGDDSPPHIVRSVVTGYGEDLIRAAFGFDEGMVETLAHFRAARAFDEDVSFILDIGGQDMKAIYVRNGHIQNIEINEACSSGCGSFIESFSRSMGYEVSGFAQLACTSGFPCDLGTRCTVFMNSKVKQALRENAEVGDISAGLAYSVIKNALHKVLQISDTSTLGDRIIVQGGTFRNPAIHKAMENLLDKQVLCPDIAELMGAYGAALTAQDTYCCGVEQIENDFVGLENLGSIDDYTKKHIRCRGCENKCAVTKLIFQNGNAFYTGNRCEKIYTNSGKRERIGTNLPDLKYHLLFDRETDPVSTPRLILGIPRVLNLYENFPFWNTLFVECGIKVRLSDPSSNALSEKGAGTIMSENICFPAKIAHGHIYNLIEAGVDRIFYPMVFYEKSDFSDAANCYNCPIISGYPDVIRSAIDPEGKFGIPLDMPSISFQDQGLLRKACSQYLKELGISSRAFRRAFARAVEAQQEFKEEIRAIGADILDEARADGRPIILLMGRPYQIDPMINHKVPEILINFGIDVITEDAIPMEPDQILNGEYASTQWEYSNRFYHAAHWAGQQDNVQAVQLNSFGCGPDATIVDNIRSILSRYGKGHTVIRVDEIESTGSTKLRLRSMIEVLRKNGTSVKHTYTPGETIRLYRETDRRKTVIVPQFSRFCSPPFVGALVESGYKVESLPPSDRESVQVGLRYANNEICYPGIVVAGDLIRALQSGKYDLSDVVIGFFESGGQCRATTYLSMLKRALISAGFEDTTIVTVSLSAQAQNEQPGFELALKEFLPKAVLGIIYSDILSTMYHATAIRELHKGEALDLANRYLLPLEKGALSLNRDSVLATLEKAVADFNDIETNDRDYPIVGLVGEIYLKYNSFGNNQIVQWFWDQDIEVIVPPLMEFFSQWVINVEERAQANVERADMLRRLLSFAANKYLHAFLGDVDAAMKRFRYYRPSHTIQNIAKKAQEIVSLTHQYGEGWLIAGEIGTFVEDGVLNVLCLQPFGCIANHVVAKGVGTRLKEKYPQLNLLFLDIDAGISEVNLFNRLHFFIDHARIVNNGTRVCTERGAAQKLCQLGERG
jgi:predicted CoA-substrate-specific enzyme activase